MNTNGLWSHLALLLGAMLISCLGTAVARTLAPRLGLLDVPGGRKRHGQATPLMGGVAVYATLLAGACLAARGGWLTANSFSFWLLVSGGLFCLLGLADDKWTLRARDKFVLQILATLPFVLGAGPIETVSLFGWQFPLGGLAVTCTIFWLVASANVVNLLDGVDGLASSIGLVGTAAAYALALMAGHVAVAALAALLAGSLVGFLFHNRPPAKIFLGDAGSLTLGFLVGGLLLQASTTPATGLMLMLPVVVMSVPAFDTAMAIVRRKLSGRGIGDPDRGHIHHCQLARGMSSGQTVLLIGGLCFVMALAALTAAYLESDLLAFGLCGAVLVATVAGGIFGRHEADLFFRHGRAVLRTSSEASAVFRTQLRLAQLEITTGGSPEATWALACKTAQKLGIRRLEFRLTNPSDSGTLSWTDAQAEQGESHDTFIFALHQTNGLAAEVELHAALCDPLQVQRASHLLPLAHLLLSQSGASELSETVAMPADPAPSLAARNKAA